LRQPTQAPPRGRAHRKPRPRDQRGHHAPARPDQPHRHHRPHGHPRPAHRRPVPAPGGGARGRRGGSRWRPRNVRGGPVTAARFIASEVWQGLRRNLSMTLAMIITTAVALAMLGAGLLVVMTASASQDKYDYLNEFRVYVDRSISREDPDCTAECGQIRAQLESTAGVASVEYKDPEETYS